MALTQISTKGIKDGTITGTDLATNVDLVDNQKLRLGTGNDLQIFHTGTASKINNANVPLLFQSDAMSFHGEGGSETMAVFTKNGAVELYHDNSKKFETKSTGVIITGNDASGSENLGSFLFKTASGTVRGHFDTSNDRFGLKDNVLAAYGNSNDLQIFHNGTNSHIHSATGELDIRSDDFHLRNSANNENIIVADANGGVHLYHDNSKKLETTSTGATVTGTLLTTGDINVPSSNSVVTGSVVTQNASAFTAVDNGIAYFGTGLDLRIFHDGSVTSHIAETSNNLKISIAGGSNTLQLNKGVSSPELMAQFTGDLGAELYFDNTKRLETLSDGAQCHGTMHVRSEDSNVIQHTQALYLSVAASGSNTITLTGLLGTAHFFAGGYANAGQGALALNIFFGGAMFGTQHYNVNVLQNSGMQNASISLQKNGTSYVITISNASTTASLNLSMYVESTGSQVTAAIA